VLLEMEVLEEGAAAEDLVETYLVGQEAMLVLEEGVEPEEIREVMVELAMEEMEVLEVDMGWEDFFRDLPMHQTAHLE
jgi:hypothetical protein